MEQIIASDLESCYWISVSVTDSNNLYGFPNPNLKEKIRILWVKWPLGCSSFPVIWFPCDVAYTLTLSDTKRYTGQIHEDWIILEAGRVGNSYLKVVKFLRPKSFGVMDFIYGRNLNFKMGTERALWLLKKLVT